MAGIEDSSGEQIRRIDQGIVARRGEEKQSRGEGVPLLCGCVDDRESRELSDRRSIASLLTVRKFPLARLNA